MSKVVQPSVRETAFNCPHCGVLTTQFWSRLYAALLPEDQPVPLIFNADHQVGLLNKAQDSSGVEREQLLAALQQLCSGLVVIRETDRGGGSRAYNLHLSKCYNCKRIAVWVYDRLLFPASKAGPQPNTDLPEDIVRDFEESREIVNASPRGAAALLRLCIQKLCTHLGEKGKNIDGDIASLVKKGLDPLIQQSLDIVRVIGNEAVHPGEMDLKDDRDTALQLFDLVNAICDQMISHPKAVAAMYSKLPEGKRKAIAARDKKGS